MRASDKAHISMANSFFEHLFSQVIVQNVVISLENNPLYPFTSIFTLQKEFGYCFGHLTVPSMQDGDSCNRLRFTMSNEIITTSLLVFPLT